jgi:uncharacterized alkaline shock family protein YloU
MKQTQTESDTKITKPTNGEKTAKPTNGEKTAKPANGGNIRVAVKEEPSSVGGRITLDVDVVATIAGLAAKEIEGIYSVGKSSWYRFGDKASRGVHAEVGQSQAAFDLDVVIEYGYDVREVARELRKRTAVEVQKMAGREVIELNVHVVDIHLPAEAEPKSQRVQ